MSWHRLATRTEKMSNRDKHIAALVWTSIKNTACITEKPCRKLWNGLSAGFQLPRHTVRPMVPTPTNHCSLPLYRLVTRMMKCSQTPARTLKRDRSWNSSSIDLTTCMSFSTGCSNGSKFQDV